MRRAAAITGVRTFVAPPLEGGRCRRAGANGYRELAAGATRADSLRRAQLELLRASGKDGFLIWTPVILFGDPTVMTGGLFRRPGE